MPKEVIEQFLLDNQDLIAKMQQDGQDDDDEFEGEGEGEGESESPGQQEQD